MLSGPFGFSPMILAYTDSVLTWFDYTVTVLLSSLTYGGTCLPNSMYNGALAHAAVPYQAFHYNIIYLSR